jgi:polar amino acid transport system substrate-binding protein
LEKLMKLKTKFAAALFSGALAALVLAPSLAAADTLDDIKSRGKIVVAIDPTFAPYEFTDSSGKIVGYTPAIMEAVARKIGVSLEYEKMAFNGIIPGLLAKSFDLEGSSLNVTAERAKRVMFTVPFGKSANGVLTRVDDSRVPAVTTVESLAGLTAIVKAATAPEKLLKEFNTTLAAKGLVPIQIVSLDTVEQTITALLAKRGDFVFDDITVLGAAMQQNPGKLRGAGELGATQWMAWATRPDDARLNKVISDVILGMQKSGELAALQKKYLGVTVVVPEANFIPKQ